MKKSFAILVLLSALVAACTLSSSALETARTSPTPTGIPAPTVGPAPCGPAAVTSDQAIDYMGRTITVQIDRAYCSYRPDVKGNPTFCNDAPYPTHDFTMLVWGQDWSDYDGHCICVHGKVTPYKGKPQIVLESRSDVSLCR